MTVLDDLFSESGLDPDEMVGVADALAPLADVVEDAPPPSAALAALFHVRPADGRATRALRQRSSAAAGVVVLAFSSVGATGLSAAANTLPPPLQHQVSLFSRHYLPFDLPEPPGRREHAPLSSGRGGDQARIPSDVEESSRSQAQRPDLPEVMGDPRGTSGGTTGHPGDQSQPETHPRHDSAHGAGPADQASSAPATKPPSTPHGGGDPAHGPGKNHGPGKQQSGAAEAGSDQSQGAAEPASTGTDQGKGTGHGSSAEPDTTQGNAGSPDQPQGGDTTPVPGLPAVPLPVLPPAAGGAPGATPVTGG